MAHTLAHTLAAAVASSSAQALTFHMETSGTSQVIEVIDPLIPVLRFATQTEGSGDYGLTGYLSTDLVNMATGQGSGSNRFVASSGDELYGSFSVQIVPTATPGLIRIEGLTNFQGGSGIFDGATGSASCGTGLAGFSAAQSLPAHPPAG